MRATMPVPSDRGSDLGALDSSAYPRGQSPMPSKGRQGWSRRHRPNLIRFWTALFEHVEIVLVAGGAPVLEEADVAARHRRER